MNKAAAQTGIHLFEEITGAASESCACSIAAHDVGAFLRPPCLGESRAFPARTAARRLPIRPPNPPRRFPVRERRRANRRLRLDPEASTPDRALPRLLGEARLR